MTEPDTLDGPRLDVIAGPRKGSRLPLRDGAQELGRDPAADLHLADEDVSRRHARLTVDATGLVLEDLGSKNGVFVRGAPIERATHLVHGDRFDLGDSTLQLVHPGSRVAEVLARGGEMTVTRTRTGDSATPAEAPAQPGLLRPIIGVVVCAVVLMVLLMFG